MAFNSTASRFSVFRSSIHRRLTLFPRVYCGFQDAIEVFDINYPGEGDRIFTSPSKKSKSGLKGRVFSEVCRVAARTKLVVSKSLGIISSLAFCPDYSGLYAAGTFSSSLVLFAENTQAEIVQSLGGVRGPITQVVTTP
jgi:telomerase Cajal body protein 1